MRLLKGPMELDGHMDDIPVSLERVDSYKDAWLAICFECDPPYTITPCPYWDISKSVYMHYREPDHRRISYYTLKSVDEEAV